MYSGTPLNRPLNGGHCQQYYNEISDYISIQTTKHSNPLSIPNYSVQHTPTLVISLHNVQFGTPTIKIGKYQRPEIGLVRASLVPRPSEGEGEGRPGIHCMRMHYIFCIIYRKSVRTLIPTTC